MNDNIIGSSLVRIAKCLCLLIDVHQRNIAFFLGAGHLAISITHFVKMCHTNDTIFPYKA